MTEFTVRITLRSPVILSEDASTTDAHRTLDYIPGRVFLGIAAGALYRSVADPFETFHSGAIRFSDALPVFDGSPGRPTPFSLHQPKGATGELFNLAATDRPPGRQLEQLRSGYVWHDGSAARHGVVDTTRFTKIAMADMRAREGFLFTYEAVREGQVFQASIRADEAAKGTLQAIAEALRGRRRIGRSRHAQFGEVDIEIIDGTRDAGDPDPDVFTGQTRLSLHALSDAAFVDPYGQPTFTPTPDVFGLPDGWELDIARTFVRTRAVDRFNGHRRAFDVQRQVIRRGSVLSFHGPAISKDDAARIASTLRRRVGVDRAEGLGWFEPLPPWLHGEDLTISSGTPDRSVNASGDVTNTELYQLLERRAVAAESALDTEILELARTLSKLPGTPSPSQWGSVRQWALEGGVSKTEFLQLVGGGTKTLRKGWEIEFRKKKLGDWLVDDFGESRGGPHIAALAAAVRGMLVNEKRRTR